MVSLLNNATFRLEKRRHRLLEQWMRWGKSVKQLRTNVLRIDAFIQHRLTLGMIRFALNILRAVGCSVGWSKLEACIDLGTVNTAALWSSRQQTVNQTKYTSRSNTHSPTRKERDERKRNINEWYFLSNMGFSTWATGNLFKFKTVGTA